MNFDSLKSKSESEQKEGLGMVGEGKWKNSSFLFLAFGEDYGG